MLHGLKNKVVPLVRRLFSDNVANISIAPELNTYMIEPRVGNEKEDILAWWRSNQCRFPILSKMARDYLAIQASGVPAERGFSRSGLTITKLRNRLHPETVRSLMCLQSWLKLDIDCE